MPMYLWKISQDVNTGWDTYDSAVVAAKTGRASKGISAGVIVASFKAG